MTQDTQMVEVDVPVAFYQWLAGIERDVLVHDLTPQEIAALVSIISQQSVPGWQPISSAPRDGTLFDVWVPSFAAAGEGYRIANVRMHGGCLYRKDDSLPANLVRWPSHWRLPPAPPSNPLPTGQETE